MIPAERGAVDHGDVGRNWGGSYLYGASALHRPTGIAALQALVARTPAEAGTLHALGTRHSFTAVADADELVSLADLPGSPVLDSVRHRVQVPAAMRYGDLARWLDERGFALGNLASLPHISVAGSVATSTHGSGDRNPTLSAQVTGLQLVTAGGDLMELTEQSPELPGAVVGLGALGVVTRLELAVEPTYEVRQDVWVDLPWESLTECFDDVFAAGYSVSLMTTLAGPYAGNVWVKDRVGGRDPGERAALFERLGAAPADRDLHPSPGQPAHACTPQLGRPGPWHERLPHFRLDHTPSTGAEIHSEWLMDRRHAPAAVAALRPIGDRIAPLVHSAEIRTVAADDLWLSNAHGRDSVAIHLTWRPDEAAARALLPEIEARLAPFAPRPHWGKLFGRPAAGWQELYPRWDDFVALTERLDPHGRFATGFLRDLQIAGQTARSA